jgi:hypothetical protein
MASWFVHCRYFLEAPSVAGSETQLPEDIPIVLKKVSSGHRNSCMPPGERVITIAGPQSIVLKIDLHLVVRDSSREADKTEVSVNRGEC